MAVGVEYLAKKFEQTETDLIEALKECGFTIPASAKDQPVYLEYDGDLYWLNLNHRGQLWINTREKLRAMFRPVHGQRVAPETPPEEKPAGVKPQVENAPPVEDAPPVEKATEPPEKTVEPLAPAAAAPSAPPPASNAAGPLPGGPELLDRLRPAMRRNRHGGGLSGSVSYLARAFRTEPRALEAAFEALGLALPSRPNEKPASVGIGPLVYWLNRDKTGQVWINAREKRDEVPPPPAAGPAPEPVLQPAPGAAEPPAETKPEAVAAASAEARPADTLPPAPPPAEVPPAAQAEASPLAAARLLLTETKRGGVAEELGTHRGKTGQEHGRFAGRAGRRRAEGAGEGAREAGVCRARRRDPLAQPERQGAAVAECQGLEVPGEEGGGESVGGTSGPGRIRCARRQAPARTAETAVMSG